MKRLVLILGFLAVFVNIFAFSFMGVDIEGDVEVVADNLASKGFVRKIGTVQTGPDKGKREVMKTEDTLFLEGKYEGNDATLLLRFPKKDDIVSELYLSIEKPSFSEILSVWKKVSNGLEEKYGTPDIDADVIDFPNSNSKFIKQWEFKDVTICLDMPKKGYEVLFSIAPND